MYFTVRACDMNACFVFGPGESPQAATGRLQVQIPTQAGLVLSYGGLFTWCKKLSSIWSVGGEMRQPTSNRYVTPTPLAAILPGRVLDHQVHLMFVVLEY